MMLFWLLIWLLILIFNTVHSFLPTKLQGKKWIRVTAMIIATTILLRSGWQDISSYQSRTYLHITPDGKIDSQNNFPWDVSITSTPKGPAYLVSHRGDGSEIEVTSDDPALKPNVWGGYSGIFIDFNCPSEKMPGITIRERE